MYPDDKMRMAMMKRPGHHPPGTEYFRTRLGEVTAELVLERSGDSEEGRMRARLAGGVVTVLMDTAHNCWMEAGPASHCTTSANVAVG